MTSIRDNLQTIGANIKSAEKKYKRPNNSVQLLAVSKRHSCEKIKQAYDAGQKAFGENYVQEFLEKKDELRSLDIEWHFIGPLQSNKTRKISENADWVHTIDRLKIAQRLDSQRPVELKPLKVCIQLNISGEESKSGITINELPSLAKEIYKLPKLKLKGLMVIPAPESSFNKQRETFKDVKQQLELLNLSGLELNTLSMGMSNDMEAAIAEGATIVRIGTAIFGEREN